MPFSTPFTFCSIGVATDASTSVAEAPTKVVVIWTIGGTTSGYWAIGRPDIATSPRITVTMEITIATIGRLTKKRAMAYFAFPASAAGSAAPGAVAAATGLGLTTEPSRTFWRPSTTTFSPGFRPSSITHRPSTRGPTLTLRNVTLLSAPTTATL